MKKCLCCGVLATSPRPTPEATSDWYPAEYYAYTSVAWSKPRWKRAAKGLLQWSFCGYPFPLRINRVVERGLKAVLRGLLGPWKHRLDHIPRYVSDGRLLDVGCGAGTYLGEMRALGWATSGVEASVQAARICERATGSTVFAGSFLDHTFEAESFDVVTMFHVLEHFRFPRAALAEVQRLLKPGGQILVEVPNASSLAATLFGVDWFAWELPRHLYHFTPEALVRLLSDCGFDRIEYRFPRRSFVAEASLRYRLQSRATRIEGPLTGVVVKFLAAAITFVATACRRGDYLQLNARKGDRC